MRAKLIYSDLLYTASLAVFDEVKRNADNAKKHIIIVPDKYTLICEKLLLDRLGLDCSFNAEVMSINRFCSKVVKIDEKLDKQGGVILIQSILFKLNDKLQAFQNMYRQIGFAENIYATCMQIKASGISADMVSESDADEVLLKRKLADLKLIYSAYESAVESGLTDGLKKIEQLNAEIKSNAIFNDLAVYFAFFDFFTRQEYKIIENLILNGNYVCVGAGCGLGKLNEHIYTNEVYDNISALFFKYNLKDVLEVKEVLPLNYEKIKNELFSFCPSVAPLKTDDVLLLCAEDENKEIEAVAKRIKAYVTSEKIKYNQINVALGSIEKYKLAIENVFNEYEIPYFLDDVTKLDSTELGRFLDAVFKCVSYGFMEEDLKSLIFNYYFGLLNEKSQNKNEINENHLNCENEGNCADNQNESGESCDDCAGGDEVVERSEEIYKFINLLSPNGIKWLSKAYDNISENVKSALNEINDKIQFIIGVFSGLNCGKDYINAIRNIFTYFNIDTLTNELMDKFASDLVINKTLSQVVPKMQNLLNQIEELSADTEYDLLSFSKLVQSGLNACKISLVPLGVDSVFVGDVSSSSFERKSVCFLVGMNLSIAPKISYDLGLVTDKDIDCLSDKYVIEPKISLINMRARQKLFEVACLAKKHLVVSYLLADSSGATLKPSILVTSICKMFSVVDERGNAMPLKPLIAYDDVKLMANLGDLLDENAKNCVNDKAKNEENKNEHICNLKCGHSFSFENGQAENEKVKNAQIEINQYQNKLNEQSEIVEDVESVENLKNSLQKMEDFDTLNDLDEKSVKNAFNYKKLMLFTENLATKSNLIKFALKNECDGLGYQIIKQCNMADYFNRLICIDIENNNKSNLPLATKLFFPQGKTSATQLTTFFSCPYMHFLNYGLRLKEDLPFKLKKLDIGQILHKVCELFAKKLKKSFESTNQPYLSGEELEKVKNEVLNVVISENRMVFENDDNRFIVKNLKKEAFKLMDNLNNFERKSAFRIAETEFSFKPIEIKNSVKSVFLAGKIDRFDKFDNKVLILDYKTGDSDLNYKKIYYGLKIQLLIYSLAVLNGGKGYGLAGFGYSPINDKYIKADFDDASGESAGGEKVRQDYKIKGYFDDDLDCLNLLDKTLLDKDDGEKKQSDLFNFYTKLQKNGKQKLSANLVGEESLLKMLKYVQELITVAVKNILSGFIAISPYKDGQSSVCDYCKYRGICKRKSDACIREIETKKITDLIGEKQSGESEED